MDSKTPDLIFACEGSPYSGTISAEFRDAVAAEGLGLHLATTPSTRALASVEWLMPTAIMLFVAKSYIDGFLGEAGRDHYVALKNGVKQVISRLGRVAITRIGSTGKADGPVQSYSAIFSIWLQRDDYTRFKFLIPANLPPEEMEAALECFFNFLDGWYAGRLASSERARFKDADPIARTVLLAYSSETGRIEVIDPFDVALTAR